MSDIDSQEEPSLSKPINNCPSQESSNQVRQTNVYHVNNYSNKRHGVSEASSNSTLLRSILLGSKGLDLPRLSMKLESLSSAKTFEPLEPIKDTDLTGFLKNERENAILSIIEETRNSTYNTILENSWEMISMAWEKEKMDVLNSLAKADDDNIMDMAPIAEITLVNEPLRGTLRSVMDEEEVRYAQVLQDYNHASVIGAPKPSLVSQLSQLSKTFNDKKVTELWEIVECMVNVPFRLAGSPVRARESLEVTSGFISSARKYLSEKYRTYMRTIVVGDLWRSRLGGAPGLLPLIKGFVAVVVSNITAGLEDGLIDGLPIWAVIYYCLRAGVPEAACDTAKLGGPNLSDILALLEDMVEAPGDKLSRPSETVSRMHFHRISKTVTDPFKRAVYSILCASDVNDEHSEVVKTVDDYLWIKLSQIRREDMPDDQPGRLTFPQLQSLILEEYGERHFKAYDQPQLYAKLLLLTAQFEAAIEFLSRVDKLRSHGVHIALALSEMGILIVSPNIEAPLVSAGDGDKPPMRRINLGRLIRLYTRKFEGTNPKEALQYFYFLRNIRTTKGESLFTTLVSELVLESREFEYLLGRLQEDESRSKGLIDSFQGVEIDTQKIIEVVAADSENKGLFEEAIALYDLAKKTDRVMELLVRLLSQVITEPPVVGSLRERIYQQATEIAFRYSKKPHEVNAEVSRTFYLLLDLATFFDLYHSKDYQSALETIQKLNLIPFEQKEFDNKVTSFTDMSQEIRRNIPDILIATMNMLFSKYKELKAAFNLRTHAMRADETGMKKTQELYRSQAHVLVTYAGAIPYRMPGDTNSRLVQMEVLMN